MNHSRLAKGPPGSSGGILIIVALLMSLASERHIHGQAVPLTITAPASLAGSFTRTATVSWAPIDPLLTVSGQVAYVGRGCSGDAYLADPAGKVAMIDRGFCNVSDKVDRAARAGAIAVLIAMDNDNPLAFSMAGGSQFVPTLVIRKTEADLIKANLAAPVIVSLGLATGTPGAQTLAVSEVGLHSAIFSGRINPNGIETSYYFEYGISSYTDSTPVQNAGSTPGILTVQASISGLTSGAGYRFRLVATGGGLTAVGQQRFFATAELPYFSENPEDTAVMEGETAFFRAIAFGTQPIDFFMEVNGHVAPSELAFENPDFGYHMRKLVDVQLSDAGSYRMGATNPYSEGIPVYSNPAQLTVYPATPPTIGAVSVLETHTAGVTIGGEINSHGAQETTVTLEYGLTSSYGFTSTATIGTGGALELRTFAGSAGFPPDSIPRFSDPGSLMTSTESPLLLKPGKTYHIRAIASSVGGTTYGPDSMFATSLPTTHTVMNADADGAGSLRDTIAYADFYDTIVFDPALNGQTIFADVLSLFKPLTISGPGADKIALSGSLSHQVIWVSSPGTVKISGITIRDGFARGGTLLEGGAGIYNLSDLELDGCAFENNQLEWGYWALRGGAIRHKGSRLIINRCAFANNSGWGGGGALDNDVFGYYSYPAPDGVVKGSIITDSVFSGNSGAVGPGAIQSDRSLEISGSTFTGNTTEFSGGGALSNLPNHGSESLNEGLIVRTCSFSENISGAVGGAIYNEAALVVDGTTLLRNQAWQGGAVYNYGGLIGQNSTFSENSAEEGGAIFNYGQSTFKSTTLVGNTSATGASIANYGEFSLGNSLIEDQPAGIFNSLGHNLVSMGDGSSGWIETDMVGSVASPIIPALGPLGKYGGSTLTYALLAGSPAINSGDSSLAAFGTDQRGGGFARIVSVAVDIGAYEVGDPLTLLQDILIDLKAMADGTLGNGDAQKLRLIIERLTAALNPALWQDTYHLARGSSYFATQAETLALLSRFPPQMAVRVVEADRIIAVTAINAQPGVEKAKEFLEQGDKLLVKRNITGAAAQYASAWSATFK
jgi:hypothetical protein